MSNSIFCMMFMIRFESYMHKGASKRPYSKKGYPLQFLEESFMLILILFS